MQELEKIETSLEALQKDFNLQIHAINSDKKEFLSNIIDLTSRYPDHKDLIMFIVFISDKLETEQQLFNEIAVETLNELIRHKKEYVRKMIRDKDVKVEQVETNFWKKVTNNAALFKDIKMLLLSIAVIAVALGVVIAPDMFLEIVKALAKLLV